MSLIFLGLSWIDPASAQPIRYVEAKTKIKSRQGSPYLRWVKIYTLDGEHEVYLRHRSKDPQGKGLWYLIDDPGGEVQVFGWDKDSVCLSASRGQVRVQVSPVSVDDAKWQLELPQGTFFLTGPKTNPTGKSRRCVLFTQVQGPDPKQPPARVDLLSLQHSNEAPRYLAIQSAETLSDIPPLVRITAILMASIWLTPG